MSNYHAYADDCDAGAPTGSDLLRHSIAAVNNAMIVAVSPLRQAMARRATVQRLSGLAPHLLADLGYERDWDGSIHPFHRDDA